MEEVKAVPVGLVGMVAVALAAAVLAVGGEVVVGGVGGGPPGGVVALESRPTAPLLFSTRQTPLPAVPPSSVRKQLLAGSSVGGQ